MATTLYATFGHLSIKDGHGSGQPPALDGDSAEGLDVASVGASALLQRDGADWVAPNDGTLTVASDGGLAWLRVGDNTVTAEAGKDHFVRDGERYELTVRKGQSVAAFSA